MNESVNSTSLKYFRFIFHTADAIQQQVVERKLNITIQIFTLQKIRSANLRMSDFRANQRSFVLSNACEAICFNCTQLFPCCFISVPVFADSSCITLTGKWVTYFNNLKTPKKLFLPLHCYLIGDKIYTV